MIDQIQKEMKMFLAAAERTNPGILDRIKSGQTELNRDVQFNGLKAGRARQDAIREGRYRAEKEHGYD